ncbi:hypothetical protein MMC13_002327 [Lambiella insularis]|nr:hypothetical protein [Lambiella insularis]
MSSQGVRTRSQRLRGAASGNPPTPPQALPTTTRAKKVPRTRKAAVQPAEGSASEAQSSSSRSTTPPTQASHSHALVHIWLDPTPKTLASTAKRPAAEPSLTMAILREDVLNFLNPSKAIASKQKERVANLRYQARSEKRKLEDAAESSRKRTKRGTGPSLVVETTESEETTVVVQTTEPAVETPSVKAPMIDYPTVMYDEDGNSYYGPTDRTDLMDKAMAFARPDDFSQWGVLAKNAWVEDYLRQQKERKAREAARQAQAEKESETQDSSSSTAQVEAHQSPIRDSQEQHNLQAQTPRRWGMGSIIGGAKNLLSSIRGTPAGLIATQAPAIVNFEPAQAGASGVNERNGSGATPSASAQVAQPDAQSNTQSELHAPSHFDTSLSTTHEHQEPQEQAEGSSRVLSALATSDEHHRGIRKKKKGKKSKMSKADIFSAYQKDIDDEVARRVIAERQAESAKTHGEKRKRISPTRIPNPVGCSYGMDLDFFGSDSESDEETRQASDDSPSARPSKRARLSFSPPSTPVRQMIGDPHRAEPYTGTIFADPEANMFDPNAKVVQPETSSLTFSVPVDSDSSSASETEVTATTSNKGKAKQVHFSDTHIEALPGIASSRVSSSGPPKSAMKGSSKPVDTWQQQPPPRPNPSHAALPTATTSGDTEALARARSQALRYTPARPSGLRAASRLSSSTIATPSDIADNDELFVTAEPAHENEVIESNEIIMDEGQMGRILDQEPLGETSGNKIRHNEEDLAKAVDPEVAAALANIPDANLARYTFPERGFSEDDGDPEVTRYLNATWGIEDEERAHQTFERQLREWNAQQLPPTPTASTPLPLTH